MLAGSGTCSSISMQVTTSNCWAFLLRQFFRGDQAVIDFLAAFQQVQFRHLERFFAQVDAGDVCAARRHAFGQDAAAAADIQHAACPQAAARLSM